MVVPGFRVFTVPSFFQAFSLIYNSDEVTDPPNDYRGLLEPEFKDQIVTWAEPNAAFGVLSDMLDIEQGKVPKDTRYCIPLGKTKVQRTCS